MKRTLLYLLLFITFNFYAQINPIVHCDGNTIFDLTSRESEIIGNLNPAETTVSYYLSKFDADRGAYPISNPTSFQSTGTSTIYARIINEKSFSATITSFLLKVSATPVALNGTVKYSGCVKSVISLNASGGTFSYLYSKDGANYQIEPYFYDMGPGSHTLYVKDSNNCTATTTMIVQDINIPRLAVQSVATMPRCNGASDAQIMTFVSGGTPPYNLSILEKPDAIITMNSDINNNFHTYTTLFMSSGWYTVLVKDASGICSEINHIQIQETKAITVATTITDQTITVTANGGSNQYTYAISPTLYKFSENNVFTNLAPDTYKITVKDSNNCTLDILNLTVAPPAPVTFTLEKTEAYCHGMNTASITATVVKGKAPYKFTLNGANLQSNGTFNNLSPGTYSIQVTDDNGITSTESTTIKEPEILETKVVVNDKTITAKTTGGTYPYTYRLSNNQIILEPQSSNIFNNLTAGLYTLTTTDTNGCQFSQDGILISGQIPLSLSYSTIPATCANPTGTITANTVGGAEPYQYSIDNGKTYVDTKVFSNLPIGTYSITVRDALLVTKSIFASIDVVNPIAIEYSLQFLRCHGDNSGSITLTASKGQAPYYYSINGLSFVENNTFSNLQSGTYDLIVKDSYGCTSSTKLTIQQPNPIITTIEVKDQTITVDAKGGTGVITYALLPNYPLYSTNNTFTNLNPGIYDAIVKDENGCLKLTYVTINPKAPFIDGKNETIAAFKPGQTLADIIVDGQNIKWYSTKNSTTGRTSKMSKTAETQLPPTTVLVDGTTYYASQTINGIESKERLAVTAKLNTLSTPDFIFSNFKYHPNPVKNILTIQNTSMIDEVTLFSVSGKVVFDKKINSLHSDLDLSDLASGIYILKVKSDGQEKTIKIVKE